MSKRSKASRFPAARIKKIMQMDEDVGKLASATPVMISKSLECFMQLLLDETAKESRLRGSKKVTAYHLKHTINNTPSFDFLLDIVSKIPDPTHAEAGAAAEAASGPSTTAGPSKRKPSSSGPAGGSSAAAGPSAPKARKRKPAASTVPAPASPLGYVDEHEDRKPTLGAAAEVDMEYSGRQMVRPGLGNLLNPTEPEDGEGQAGGYGGSARVGSGAGVSGPTGTAEGGRGMFDDYEDDDDY